MYCHFDIMYLTLYASRMRLLLLIILSLHQPFITFCPLLTFPDLALTILLKTGLYAVRYSNPIDDYTRRVSKK